MKCGLAGLTGPYEGKYLTEHYKGAPGKFTAWEGGHRVPALAYWPGTIAPGRCIEDPNPSIFSHPPTHEQSHHLHPGVTSALASTLDLFPTFSALAGLAIPNDRQYDGVNLSPLLLHHAPVPSETPRVLFHPDQTGNLSAMRVGSKKIHFRVTRAPPCVAPTSERPVLPDVDAVLAKWEFVVGPQEEGWNHPHPLPLVFDLEVRWVSLGVWGVWIK